MSRNKQNRDLAYLEDQFNAYYIENGCGRYQDASQAFLQSNPEHAELLAGQGALLLAKRLQARFREADVREHEDTNPTPVHIRQAFLPFGIEVPPMAPTVNAFDGQGRVGMADATPKQHLRHHAELKRFHKRGFAYRDQSEQRWAQTIEALQGLGIEHPEHVSMAEVIELLQKRAASENEPSATSHASL
jgi:hypothetical protein